LPGADERDAGCDRPVLGDALLPFVFVAAATVTATAPSDLARPVLALPLPDALTTPPAGEAFGVVLLEPGVVLADPDSLDGMAPAGEDLGVDRALAGEDFGVEPLDPGVAIMALLSLGDAAEGEALCFTDDVFGRLSCTVGSPLSLIFASRASRALVASFGDTVTFFLLGLLSSLGGELEGGDEAVVADLSPSASTTTDMVLDLRSLDFSFMILSYCSAMAAFQWSSSITTGCARLTQR
jgi:hypothetical protein